MVRSLVEMHSSTVSVHSEGLGLGSEFIVLLPVCGKTMAPEAGPALPSEAVRNCRILVIEDNVDANETLSFCLLADGHTVASAFDGPTGLAMATEGGYDIVVCDIGLPGMDGYELLRRMRLLAIEPQPGFIAMTGYDQEGLSGVAGQAGFDRYLVKPVSIAVLQAAISTLIRPATPA